MIDYEYPDIFITEGTQKELLITDGTVTIDGTDYEVSDETVLFENNDLELEAFELSQTLCSEMELQFGFCGTSKVSFTVRKTYEDSIVGTTVKVYIIPNHDASKMLQLGVFKIYEDKQSNDHARHSIVGYDKMYYILNKDMTDWYDDILQDEEATCEMVDFRDAFTFVCGVEEEETTLVNDDLMLKRTIEKDRISGADIIKAICEINGVFGVISNEGKFRYVQLQLTGYDPSMEIPVTDYMDLQYAEYWCQPINQLTIIKDSTVKYTAGATTPQPNNYIIAYNPLITDKTLPEITQIAQRIYNGIQSLMYRALTINAIGNPVREVGDRIAVRTKDNHILYTYIFQRKLTGIQALRDTYIANGEEYLSNNLTNKSNQYAELSNQINEISQGGGSSSIIASEDFVERIRNIGFRLLDEPSNVSLEYDEDNNEVSLKWKDPSDITTNEPCPATWAGTVVVRKENSAPLHRWDGTLIVDSTTRDAYKTTALVDNTVQREKLYYYGIFPYHIWLDDINSPIRHYRYTKIISMGVKGFTFHWLYDGSKPSGQQFPDGLDYDLGNIYVEGYPSTTLPTISSNCILFSDVTHVAEFIVFNERLAPCQTLKVSVEKIANASAQNHNLHIFGGINNSGYEAQNPNYGNESIYNIYDNSIPYVIEGQFYNDDIPLNEVVTLSIPMPISSEGMFICICCSLNVKVYKIWGE